LCESLVTLPTKGFVLRSGERKAQDFAHRVDVAIPHGVVVGEEFAVGGSDELLATPLLELANYWLIGVTDNALEDSCGQSREPLVCRRTRGRGGNGRWWGQS
jgi:hypothetical protein